MDKFAFNPDFGGPVGGRLPSNPVEMDGGGGSKSLSLFPFRERPKIKDSSELGRSANYPTTSRFPFVLPKDGN